MKLARWMPPTNLDRLASVYGPATWNVYEQLEVGLDPNGPDALFHLAGEFVTEGQVMLDAGCRDATHLIEMVRRVDVGVEPVAIHIERAEKAVRTAGLTDRITLHQGVMHDLPYPDRHFDFVWCRDVIGQVDDLDGALAELVRVMKPQSRLLVYTTVATELLSAQEAAMMRRHLGNVDRNLNRSTIESAFTRSGLATEGLHVIGVEWREFAEERTQPTSRALLRLARLRRQPDEIIAAHGRDIYDHVEANLHWDVSQFLGKLQPLVYVLRTA